MQPIPSAPGYHATEDGHVVSPRGKVLGESPDKDGYLRVTVFVPGRKVRMVATLVAEAHLGPRPTTKHEVRHLNGDRTDNRAENLAYGTSKQNKDDARGHGTLPVGEQNGRAKMTADQVRELRRRVAGGQRQKDAAEEMGLDLCQAAVSHIVTGRNWGHL